MDRIKVERAIDGLTEWRKHVQTNSDIDRDISTAIEALKAQLSREGTTSVQPVATDTNVGDNSEIPNSSKGHWIFVHPLQEDDTGAYMCSECKVGNFEIDPERDFICPNCGADMRGEQNERG